MEDKKVINYDKPRIASTSIIGIVISLTLIFTITLLPVSWSALQEAVEQSKSSQSDPAGQAASAGAMALVAAIGVVLVVLLEIGILIANGICLPFAIKNRRSTLKAIRIISYVYDGLIGAQMLCATVKIILFFAGV